MLPMKLGWPGVWLAFPVCSFILRLAVTEQKCPLTDLENIYRRKLGIRPINTFVGHYFKRNMYYKIKNRRNNLNAQHIVLPPYIEK